MANFFSQHNPLPSVANNKLFHVQIQCIKLKRLLVHQPRPLSAPVNVGHFSGQAAASNSQASPIEINANQLWL